MSMQPNPRAKEQRGQLRGARRGAARVTNRYRIGGDYYTVKDLAQHFGLSNDTMYRRIRRVLGSGQPITLEALAAAGGGA
jgi:AraC-like DNA-binding protein